MNYCIQWLSEQVNRESGNEHTTLAEWLDEDVERAGRGYEGGQDPVVIADEQDKILRRLEVEQKRRALQRGRTGKKSFKKGKYFQSIPFLYQISEKWRKNPEDSL